MIAFTLIAMQWGLHWQYGINSAGKALPFAGRIEIRWEQEQSPGPEIVGLLVYAESGQRLYLHRWASDDGLIVMDEKILCGAYRIVATLRWPGHRERLRLTKHLDGYRASGCPR